MSWIEHIASASHTALGLSSNGSNHSQEYAHKNISFRAVWQCDSVTMWQCDNPSTTYYEAFASELIENYVDMFIRYYMHCNICSMLKYSIILFCKDVEKLNLESNASLLMENLDTMCLHYLLVCTIIQIHTKTWFSWLFFVR